MDATTGRGRRPAEAAIAAAQRAGTDVEQRAPQKAHAGMGAPAAIRGLPIGQPIRQHGGADGGLTFTRLNSTLNLLLNGCILVLQI